MLMQAVVSFVLSEILEEDVLINELEDELRRRHLSFLQGASCKQSGAVQVAQLITQVAAIRARENNSGRYQCFFNRFNPV